MYFINFKLMWNIYLCYSFVAMPTNRVSTDCWPDVSVVWLNIEDFSTFSAVYAAIMSIALHAMAVCTFCTELAIDEKNVYNSYNKIVMHLKIIMYK